MLFIAAPGGPQHEDASTLPVRRQRWKTSCGDREYRLQPSHWLRNQSVCLRGCAETHGLQSLWPKCPQDGRSTGYDIVWLRWLWAHRACSCEEKGTGPIWQAAVPIADMRSMPLQLRATEEVRSTPWFLAGGPAVRRHASPDPLMGSQEPRLRPDHTSPTATRLQNHACLELPSERSSAESAARPSKAGCVEAARPSVSRCDHSTGEIRRQPPSHVQKSEKRSERTTGICYRSFRKPGGKRPHIRVHICQGCRAMDFVPCRSCPRKPHAVSTSRPSVLSETPLCARR